MTRHWHAIHSGTLTSIALGLAFLGATGLSRDLEASRAYEWSHPENLGAEVNSAFEDVAPHPSSDGLAPYLTSNQPESLGGEDLWVSGPATPHDPCSPATNLRPAINPAASERSPALSRNRRLLCFATDRPGGSGGFDIWRSWCADPNADFGWQPAVNLGTDTSSRKGHCHVR
jgi:hypothetical protein